MRVASDEFAEGLDRDTRTPPVGLSVKFVKCLQKAIRFLVNLGRDAPREHGCLSLRHCEQSKARGRNGAKCAFAPRLHGLRHFGLARCLALSAVMPAKAGIQYAAASRSIIGSSGILDHPLSRMMTAMCGARTLASLAQEGTTPSRPHARDGAGDDLHRHAGDPGQQNQIGPRHSRIFTHHDDARLRRTPPAWRGRCRAR